MKKLAVIGVGSAGIQSLCHFLTWLDNSWQIVSIHDPDIPNLGIGESTNPSFSAAIENGLNFSFGEDLKHLNATLKFGSQIIDWTEKDWICPLIQGNIAIHFDTHKLKDFALPRLKEIWGNKFQEIKGKVTNLKNEVDCVSVTINDELYNFDYVIDCRGFPKDFSNYTVFENSPVNRALVHNIMNNTSDWKYTNHTATKDGWMFSLPLQNRESYGYMFNDKITDDKTAKKNFSEQIGVPENELQNIEYKFKSYYCNKIIDGRIIKNGNAAVFFEPMFANSLYLYDSINRLFFDYLIDIKNLETTNEEFRTVSKECYELICFFYHGGSKHDTDFWRYAKKYATNIIENSDTFHYSKNVLQECSMKQTYNSDLRWVFSPKALFQIDQGFGYNYFGPFKVFND